MIDDYPFLLLLGGIIFLCISLRSYLRYDYLRNDGGHAEAIVLDYEKKFDSSEEGMTYIYYPIVRFKGPDGHPKLATLPQGSSSQRHKIGKTLQVVYDLDNPTVAVEKGSLTLWSFVPTLIIGILACGYYLFT